MKIISGLLKGRNVIGYNIAGTRPTMDRVKESIFSTIQNNVSDSIVLDLFAGSGNYGFEALSNYAKFVYFNDCNKEAIDVIKKNALNFNVINSCKILNYDYNKCLRYINENNLKFDLIFLDPPYKMHIINDILLFISKNNLLNENGLIIAEMDGDKLHDRINNLEVKKIKKYGTKEVYIFEKR